MKYYKEDLYTGSVSVYVSIYIKWCTPS